MGDQHQTTEPSYQPSGGGALPEPAERLALLGPADLEACLALDAASLGGLWSRDQWSVELQEQQRPGVGLFSVDALQAMACGWLVLEELHITLVAVQPQQRRRGLGLRVLQELICRGRELGAERATLEVSVANNAAQALYARCGFLTAGRRRRYYRDGSDALIQWVRLDDVPQPRRSGPGGAAGGSTHP